MVKSRWLAEYQRDLEELEKLPRGGIGCRPEQSESGIGCFQRHSASATGLEPATTDAIGDLGWAGWIAGISAVRN
jgi:hypothetical protein